MSLTHLSSAAKRLVLICHGLILSASLAGAQSAYQGDIDTWVQQDALDPPPKHALLFVGSSSIRLWEQLALDFSAWDVIQRGFGGSQFSDLNQFVDQIVLPYRPAGIFVFEGTNDLAAGKSPAQIFADYQNFVNLVHTGQDPSRLPIPIVFIGITPTPARQGLLGEATQLNDQIRAFTLASPALFYADIPTPFLATGTPPSSSLFLSDGLHLNQLGYDIWTSVLRPLARLASPPTRPIPPATDHLSEGQRLLFDFGPSNTLDGSHTASPDSNGNHWENWYAVSGGQAITAGQHRGNLVDSQGQNTGFSLVISGEFQSNGKRNGGLLQSDPLLLGELAIDSATQDFFYSDNNFLPGSFYLRGLDPKRSFELAFFACRINSEVRSTSYQVLGANMRQGVLVTSGAGSGNLLLGNNDTILRLSGLRPDARGRLFVDLERVAGSFAYVNSMQLTVGPRHKNALRSLPIPRPPILQIPGN